LVFSACGDQSRCLTIPRSGFQLVLSHFQQDWSRQRLIERAYGLAISLNIRIIHWFRTVLLERAIIACCLLQGVEGTWTVSVLTVGSFALNLYLLFCLLGLNRSWYASLYYDHFYGVRPSPPLVIILFFFFNNNMSHRWRMGKDCSSLPWYLDALNLSKKKNDLKLVLPLITKKLNKFVLPTKSY
jgi:hypothetical protein